MARKPKQQPQPEPAKSFDEFADDAETTDEEVVNVDPIPAVTTKSRDWRDVEKLREMRQLRRLVDDSMDFDVVLDPRLPGKS